MKVTVELVEQSMVKANDILKSVYPSYVEPSITKIEVRNAESYWGMVCPSKHWMRISRSFERIADDYVAKTALEGTVIHELIHTIPGCFNHGSKFKIIANRVNEKYPQYDIKTSTKASEYGLPEIAVRGDKYEITCPKCGMITHYKRTPKYPISDYRCSHCGSGELVMKRIAP